MSDTPEPLEPTEGHEETAQELYWAEALKERERLMEEAGFVVTPVHLSDADYALMCEGLQTLFDEKNTDLHP
jgi:hypothetical protein